MKKALAALVAMVAVTIGVWAYLHPPTHLPGSTLDNPAAIGTERQGHRLPWHITWPPNWVILDNPLLFQPPPPRMLTKVISASACSLINGFTWNGPGVVAQFGAVLPTPGDYIVNPNPPTQGPVTPETSPDAVVLFCDARLPAEAVALDYAELEYFAADEPGNVAPTLATYLDARAPSINGFAYDQTMALGSCTGDLSPLYSGINPVSLCDTDGGQSFYPDAGLPAVWPGAGWTLFSVHFVVTIPPSPDPSLPNLVYRILVHYEAP